MLIEEEMRNHIAILIIICAALCLPAQTSWAADVKFEVSLDRSVIGLGESAHLGLSFHGTQSMPAPDISNINGLDVRYLGPSTMMTVMNGQVSTSITHMYSIIPLKIGAFQLGPFSFKYKGDTYTSNVAVLEVTEEKVLPGRTGEEPAVEQLDLGDRMFVNLEIGKTSAYVNELIPVKVKFYVNRLNVSEIQLPTFAQEGFSKIEFKEPKQYRERMNGLVYDVLEFKTNIFGTKPGEFGLGPARIKCNLVTRKTLARMPSARDQFFEDEFSRDSMDDFFTRYEKHPLELKSPEAHIAILPLPSSGRPKDFTGAVGDYQFIFNASPLKVKAGDPVTLTMAINGTGNFNTVLTPKIDITEGFKVYEPQVKTEENRKTFTQVLIPVTDMIAQIPKAVFSYFDPNQKEYKVITQGPIPLQVEKAKEESPSQVIGPVVTGRETRQAEELARDIIYIKETPGNWLTKDRRIYDNKFFILLALAPLIFLISLSIVQGRRRRLKSDTQYASRLAALRYAKKGLRDLKKRLKPDEPKIFYETLFSTLQGYLGNRFYIPPAGTTYTEIELASSGKDIDLDILRKVKKLFEACDEMRFAFSEADIYRMQDNFKDLEEIIKYLERRKI